MTSGTYEFTIYGVTGLWEEGIPVKLIICGDEQLTSSTALLSYEFEYSY
jgi:hypothetical protein